jgi:hypothetical protein
MTDSRIDRERRDGNGRHEPSAMETWRLAGSGGQTLQQAIARAEQAQAKYEAMLQEYFRGRATSWQVFQARYQAMRAWSRVVELRRRPQALLSAEEEIA